jgi:hypothetical protein
MKPPTKTRMANADAPNPMARCPWCKRFYRRGNVLAHALHQNKQCLRGEKYVEKISPV